MSVLLVEVVPQGIIFGADRNVTQFIQHQGKGAITEIRGQSQRPKVLRWPRRKALIGYVGDAQIGGVPTDEWLYDFIGDHLTFSNFADLSESLRASVEKQRSIDEGGSGARPLIIHLGGFEERDGVKVPVIWYIRNTYSVGEDLYGGVRKEFEHSEEFWRYFPNSSPLDIRATLAERSARYDPFWFHQGFDLGTFNLIEVFLKGAFRVLSENRPLDHPLPSTLSEWEKQIRMSILTYAAYFEAYKGPGEQFVGGGADTVSIEWPQGEGLRPNALHLSR